MKRGGHAHRKGHPPWLWPNLLGLDAPAVAVTWQWAFARAWDADLPWIFHLILGLSVWCIYLADRLYDAHRAPHAGKATDRLGFTKRNSRILLILAAAAGSLNLFLIMRHVPPKLILSGTLTALLLCTYYLLRFRGGAKMSALVPREMLCGMLFALGTAIAPHAFLQKATPDIRIAGPVILFGLTCSASCILISVWERDEDIATEDPSSATRGYAFIPHMATATTCLAILSAGSALFGSWQTCLAAALSAMALRIMLRFDNRMPTSALRALADGVLLTPLLFALA